MYSHNYPTAHPLKTLEPNDLLSSLGYIIGFHDWTYRKKAVDSLQLGKGDQVVEIGCGTGRNFELLEHAVGPGGKIVAVDLSEKMLMYADKRAARHGWSNVELVQSDAITYGFPDRVDGVLSTYTLVALPEYDRIIERACQSLGDGKRCVTLDQKLPSGSASRLVPLLDFLSRPLNYSGIVGV